jgi:predicted RNase H-like HicB family nuclease
VPPEPRRNPARLQFTVVVEQIAANGFDLRVPELPGTWTVAFERDEIEARARTRIALDTGYAADEFDVRLEFPPIHVERRANRRS